MLDSDVATLYNYQKKITETVSRNKERFLKNFCFQLIVEETEKLKMESTILDFMKITGRKLRQVRKMKKIYIEEKICSICF